MSNLINYTATRANALKNWHLMTRAASKKPSIKKDFRFWPFHEMFMNHIENMGWITSLIITESGTDYNIAKDFEQVKIEKIETDYQALKIATQPTDNIKKLKLLGVYTWIFNSCDESSKYFLAKESNNHHQS